MSKSVKRVVKNSFFQTFGAFGMTGLNFVLMLGYARILGPESFGSLVTSQAQVIVWTLLVDLGLTQALISSLTAAEGGKTELARQGFRARDLVSRVLIIRLLGACIGAGGVYLLARAHRNSNPLQMWQDLAFIPYLFALAVQQTAFAFASFRHHQGFSVCANVFGVFVTVVLALFLAWKGAAIPWLLLAQSWGGLLTGLIVFGYFFFLSLGKKKRGETRRLERSSGPWGGEAWRALARDAWPYAISFAVFVLWQRLDQIAASHWLGFAQGGQYALAVRLVAIPILVATSISFALFPEVQRVGRDAPERVTVILGALVKVIYRYGILIAAFILIVVARLMVPLVPKFVPALNILPWFVPGVWAFWMQSFVVNALFGMRRYYEVVAVHVVALVLYIPCLYILPRHFGLYGVVWSSNVFCLAMFFGAYRAAKKTGVLPARFSLYGAFLAEEKKLWAQAGLKIRGWTHKEKIR